jgi:hypothetical protein
MVTMLPFLIFAVYFLFSLYWMFEAVGKIQRQDKQIEDLSEMMKTREKIFQYKDFKQRCQDD